jgi:hypothetical protein
MTAIRTPIPAWLEALLLALCAAVCSIQLLLPGYIGIANNGDFGKVFARFSCAPPDGAASNFRFFVADYDFAPRYYWKSDFVTSEIPLAGIPLLAARAAGARSFNIRWLGALDAVLFLAAYYALLMYLRRWGRAAQAAIGLLALWIFGDVVYVAYFNSFFSDTPGILGLLLMVALGLRLSAQDPPRRITLCLFALSALLFVCSKTQHGLWGFFPALFALGLTWRFSSRRIWGALICVVLLAAEAGMFMVTPAGYGNEALFNLIFFKLAPGSRDPHATVRALGLGPADYRWIGTHAFMAGSPVANPAWLADFGRRTGYPMVLRYYARHPRTALRVLAFDLRQNTPYMRPENLSNFRKEQGHPPGALTDRFASWSNLRARLFRRWPWHIVVWYLVWIGTAVVLLWNGRTRRASVLVGLAVAAMGIGEFLTASLADACETYRHLLLFHLLTDVTVCLAIGWILTRFPFFRRGIIQIWKSPGWGTAPSSSGCPPAKLS